MELLVMVDALKRASAGRITATIPYFGYARQDRRSRSSRVPIAAKLVANMLAAAGVDRVLTMDLHAEQIQGFFDIPADNIYGLPILLDDINKQNYQNPMVVSPDHGGVVRARSLAKRLECDLAIIDKRRPKANVSEVMNIIGEVQGRTCIIMDDMVDTAGTLCKAAAALKQHGALQVVAYCTHPVLSGAAVERLNGSELDQLVVTDTIPLRADALSCSRIRQLSVAPILAETIRRIFHHRPGRGPVNTTLESTCNSNLMHKSVRMKERVRAAAFAVPARSRPSFTVVVRPLSPSYWTITKSIWRCARKRSTLPC
jgi:ribose-phosphate pyrophosphokinase